MEKHLHATISINYVHACRNVTGKIPSQIAYCWERDINDGILLKKIQPQKVPNKDLSHGMFVVTVQKWSVSAEY